MKVMLMKFFQITNPVFIPSTLQQDKPIPVTMTISSSNSASPPKLKEGSIDVLKSIVDKATQNPKTEIPGITVSVSNSKGDELFNYSNGFTDANATEELTNDHIGSIASCTKIVTSIAALQLVEQGKLDLDDPKVVEKYAVEVTKLPIISLDEDGETLKLRPRKKDITLRHLLTHTSGLAYSFSHPLVKKFVDQFTFFDGKPLREFQDHKIPLVFEPGERWIYGIGLEWVTVIIERFTGSRLDEYFEENIFKPLGVKDITFLPVATGLSDKLLNLSTLNPETGKLEVQGLRKDILKKYTRENTFFAGGGGLFAKPKEFIKILVALLNDGTSPTTNQQILKKETVELIFTNQLPQWPHFIRGVYTEEDRINKLTDENDPYNIIHPQKGVPPQGWGLSLLLTPGEGENGRGNNTGEWGGSANWYYWVDREKGIAGVVGGQVVPYGLEAFVKLWRGFEAGVYQSLEV